MHFVDGTFQSDVLELCRYEDAGIGVLNPLSSFLLFAFLFLWISFSLLFLSALRSLLSIAARVRCIKPSSYPWPSGTDSASLSSVRLPSSVIHSTCQFRWLRLPMEVVLSLLLCIPTGAFLTVTQVFLMAAATLLLEFSICWVARSGSKMRSFSSSFRSIRRCLIEIGSRSLRLGIRPFSWMMIRSARSIPRSMLVMKL